MKARAILGLGLVAVLGFAVASCGSGKRRVSITFTRPTTTMIVDVRTGTTISCDAGPGAKAVGISVVVPPPGQGTISRAGGAVGESADEGNASAKIQLTHLRDGAVTVSCRSSH